MSEEKNVITMDELADKFYNIVEPRLRTCFERELVACAEELGFMNLRLSSEDKIDIGKNIGSLFKEMWKDIGDRFHMKEPELIPRQEGEIHTATINVIEVGK
jgi:hypothetical protein